MDLYEVTFKVGPNRQGLNASDVARKIGTWRKQYANNYLI